MKKIYICKLCTTTCYISVSDLKKYPIVQISLYPAFVAIFFLQLLRVLTRRQNLMNGVRAYLRQRQRDGKRMRSCSFRRGEIAVAVAVVES